MPPLAEVLLPNLIILGAALLQTSAGIGFAMIAVPLLGLIDIAWLPGPMLQANVVLSLAMAVRDRRALAPREAPPLGAGLALGTVLGAGILVLIPADRLGLMIGLILIAGVIASLAVPPLRLDRRTVFAAGTAGGMTGVIAAMHGPPLILLYQRERPAKVRATMASVFVVGSLMALASLWLTGRYGASEMVAGLLLLPGLALGYLAGCWVAGRISPVVARATMLTIAGIGGAALISKSL